MSTGAVVDFHGPWDEAIFRGVNGLAWPWLDALFVAASSRGLGLSVLVVLLVGFALRFRRRSLIPAMQLLAASGLTDALGARIIKPLVGRMRPCFALPAEHVRQLVEVGNVGSMPSLHSANAFAVATVVTLTVPRLGFVTVPLAGLIALSRVGVGVHWPSDIVAGALFGTAIGVGVVAATRGALGRVPAARPFAVESASPTPPQQQAGQPQEGDGHR